MKSYTTLIFDSCRFDEAAGTIKLNYSLDDELRFTETLTLPTTFKRREIRDSRFENALFALHLIGGISYYKTCLPKNIVIKSGTLTEKQAKFWNTVYENGLGEFFYRNNIDFRGLIDFPHVPSPPTPLTSGKTGAREASGERAKRVLVPIGGGKDSIVTIELLKKSGVDITLFRMEPHPLIDELAKITDLPLFTVKRTLSSVLFELNKQGALNGHIPISAYLSFLSILIAELYGFDAIVMSNERSADYGNVQYLGTEINHQWSKGIELERMLQNYLESSIESNVQYFSLLRPFSELAIARMFTRYPQYFRHATSCNRNWRILGEKQAARWCGECPKCAFVFAIFAAFLPKQTLLDIFSKNLFEDEKLIPLYRELLGIEGFKPFECVGTPEESLAAFILAYERGELNETPVMRMAQAEAALPEDTHAFIEEQFSFGEHAIPPAFLPVLG